MEKFGKKGLVVVGVSDEAESKLADYVQEKEPRYPIIRAPGAMEKYGGKYYPSFFTISPDGTILSVPEERIPPEKLIEDALRKVVILADLPKDPLYAPLRRAYKKRKFKRVADWFAKTLANQNLDAQARELVEQQRDKFDARRKRALERIGQLREGPDYLAARETLRSLSKDYAGLPVAERAKELLAEFARDPKIKKEIAASMRLEKVFKRHDPNKASHRKKLLRALQSFRRKYDGTHAAERATKKVAALIQQR